MTPALAVWGTTSGAGKSLLTTGLARWFARQDVRVVPFKAQNMSTHARVVDGGEIGAAQWLQALAAGVIPDVRMNPVLTKPESDGRSQVVVLGQVDEELSRRAWRGRAATVWPRVAAAVDELAAGADLVLVEGAGSPAETNLADVDLANLATAAHLDARALLVSDIDRGGAFAHLHGTWALLPDEHRHRTGGFVLNRFRGDASLLAPAPADLEVRTGVPTLGVVPELAHGLPDEDGASFRPEVRGGRPRVAVVRYPTASNLDELAGVVEVADVVAVAHPADLREADLVVLPGSKHVTSDARWLDRSGVGRAVRETIETGTPTLGVCGGAQLLGDAIVDVDGVEGPAGVRVEGLAILRLTTELRRRKVVRTSTIELPPPGTGPTGPWDVLAGRRVPGYEIHHGHTTPDPGGTQVWQEGPVLAVVAHGLLEDPGVVEALLGTRPGGLDATFDALADAVDAHLDTDALVALAGLDPSHPPHASHVHHPPQELTVPDRTAEEIPTDDPRPDGLRRAPSLVVVNTGNGKGKSSAAVGVIVRAVARDWRVGVVQFLKSGTWKTGEEKVCRQLGVDWWAMGEGFTWDSEDLELDEAVARGAWEQARSVIAAGDHHLVVLDEVTYPVNWGWIDVDDLIATLRDRPSHVNVVCTGRNAPEALVEVADTVTEMVERKHAYQQGIRAKKGIDY